MKKRLFAFGCSLTKYAYGTYADFLSANFDEYMNFGRAGGCMSLIMDRVIEADELYQFNAETDYVVVMFTGIGRNSYMIEKNSLETHGDLLIHAANNPERKEVVWYVDNLYSEKWLIHKAWVAANVIKKVLSYRNVKHKFLLGLDYKWYLNKPAEIDEKDFNKVEDIIKITGNVESIHEYHKIISQQQPRTPSREFWNDINNFDGHPSQTIHYMFMKKHFPEYDNPLSHERYEYCKNIFINNSLKEQGKNFELKFRQLYDKTFYYKPFGER